MNKRLLTIDSHIYLYDLAGKAGIPMVKNGYWIFIDRYDDQHTFNNVENLFNRGSFNFTIAIYDTDNSVLYYFEFDT